ncbi:hypothetical protein [Nocardioides bruguierae]|uniref:Uncharacterized protein n=1 Tax=Nocardioides bruguierae TaxID=2945102 RepID=A0A9X2D8R3_9ACTN|nr:hypothetical protein [Nocardioides bruguierae]MCL8023767.1 hypothetical protein [Nocardioides bruguierae]MCM0620897.1 hypothetical protein [Nocardioides bruguierae]
MKLGVDIASLHRRTLTTGSSAGAGLGSSSIRPTHAVLLEATADAGVR